MEDCGICQDGLMNNEISILFCNHKFHQKCISNWFKLSRSCPYCRQFQPKINFCTGMSEDMRNDAIKYAIKTMEEYRQDAQDIPERLFSTIARKIQNYFDEKYGKFWICFVKNGPRMPAGYFIGYPSPADLQEIEIDFEFKENVNVQLVKRSFKPEFDYLYYDLLNLTNVTEE